VIFFLGIYHISRILDQRQADLTALGYEVGPATVSHAAAAFRDEMKKDGN
jgi:hypothetical protein